MMKPSRFLSNGRDACFGSSFVARAIKIAFEEANVADDAQLYINAHGTSTLKEEFSRREIYSLISSILFIVIPSLNIF